MASRPRLAALVARLRPAPAASPAVPTPPRRIGPLIALAFFALYGLTSAGGLTSYDGGVMYDTALAVVQRHTLALPPHHHGLPGVGGQFYSKYGIAQSAAEIPLLLLGQLVQARDATRLGHDLAMALVMLTNPLVSALALWLFFLLACEVCLSVRGALVATVLLGVASPYLPYAKTDFSEPLSALTMTGAALYLVRARRRPRAASFARAGLFVAGALLTKLTAAFVLPALALYALHAAMAGRPGRRVALTRLGAWAVGVGVGLALVGAYDVARYGHFLDTGYHAEDQPFHAPLAGGLAGLLASFGKGLLWYCPLVVVASALWPVLWRRRAEALLCLGIAVPTVIVFATYPVWWGGYCWGPRYLLPILPFLLLPMGFLYGRWPRAAALRRVVLAIVAVSVLVQVLGTTVDSRRFLNTGIHDAAYLSQPSASPLLGHAWLTAYDVVRVVDGRDAAAMLAGYPWRHIGGTSLSQRLSINGWNYWWWEVLGYDGLSGRAQLAIAAALAVLMLIGSIGLWVSWRQAIPHAHDHWHMAIHA